jgi:hypothetical protein
MKCKNTIPASNLCHTGALVEFVPPMGFMPGDGDAELGLQTGTGKLISSQHGGRNCRSDRCIVGEGTWTTCLCGFHPGVAPNAFLMKAWRNKSDDTIRPERSLHPTESGSQGQKRPAYCASGL